MNIFVVNSGSSSLKYQLFRWPSERPLCSGLVERIGSAQAEITHRAFDAQAPGAPAAEQRRTLAVPDYEAGLREVVRLLTTRHQCLAILAAHALAAEQAQVAGPRGQAE